MIKATKGFSLTEIMVSCLVLGIMMVPVFMMFSKSTTGTTRNRNEILAQQHASNLLAYATSLNYGEAFLNQGSYEIKDKIVTSSDGTEIDLSMEESIYKRNLEIKDYTYPNTSYAYKLVIVSVKWTQTGEKILKVSGLVSK